MEKEGRKMFRGGLRSGNINIIMHEIWESRIRVIGMIRRVSMASLDGYLSGKCSWRLASCVMYSLQEARKERRALTTWTFCDYMTSS